MGNKILFNVNPNRDIYTWKQLSCTYRPWQTAIQIYGEEYVDAFLLVTSFYAVYIDTTIKKKITDFINPYNSLFGSVIGIEIKKMKTDNRELFDRSIKQIIDSGAPVLVPVDLIFLHYNPMYMLEHRYKCMLVKGYDDERGLFYILDNIHIDYGASTMLTDFVIQKDELYQMYISAYKQLAIDKEIYYFKKKGIGSIQRWGILNDLGTSIKKLIAVNGLNQLEQDVLKLDWNLEREYIAEIEKTLNYRYVFFDKLGKLIETCDNSLKTEITVVKTELEVVGAELDHLRRTCIQTRIISEKKFKELKNTELSCIKALAGYLSGLNSENFCCEKIEMGLGEKTKIVNNLCAPVIFGEDKIIITHEKDKKYDTWLMQDNAVQILYDNVRKGYIEADICMETGIGEDTHAGIIIHDFRGKTYLFGIVRGEFVALYCPQKEQNYLIFEKQNYSVEEGNINKFRIEFNENMVEFFYYDLEKRYWQRLAQ